MTTPWPIRFELAVDRVHDGDTIYGVIHADAGLDIWIESGRTGKGWGLRFYGINAPELNTDAGKLALAFLQTLVKPGDTLTFDSYSFDKYQKRIDGIPYTAAGMNLCQAMLDSGNAVPYTG